MTCVIASVAHRLPRSSMCRKPAVHFSRFHSAYSPGNTPSTRYLISTRSRVTSLTPCSRRCCLHSLQCHGPFHPSRTARLLSWTPCALWDSQMGSSCMSVCVRRCFGRVCRGIAWPSAKLAGQGRLRRQCSHSLPIWWHVKRQAHRSGCGR